MCIFTYYSPSELRHPLPATQYLTTKVWASMGLCYSHNTQLHGKVRRGETSWAVASSKSAALQAHYPYKEVAVLSLLLWRHHAPQVATLLRIVHTEPGLR